MVFTAWKKSRAPFFLILMHPVTKGRFTVVRSSQTFCISHAPLQIVPCNFYFFLIWNFAFRHKFLPLWKQCFISLSLIEGAYQVRSTAAPVCSSLPGLLSASQTGAPVRGPFPLLRKHGLFAGTGYSRRSEAAAGEIKQKTRFPQSGCPFQGRRVLGMSVQRSTSAYSGCWPNHFFA